MGTIGRTEITLDALHGSGGSFGTTDVLSLRLPATLAVSVIPSAVMREALCLAGFKSLAT